MMISFFEEFPTKENLEKLKLIRFPTKLYLAAYSFEEFKKLNANSKFVKEKIWWPLLKMEEGYWFSPWSKKGGMLRIIEEARRNRAKVMWDAERPKDLKLLITELPRWLGNKKVIRKFFKEYGNNIYTAEYFPIKGFGKRLLEKCCLSFNPLKYDNHVIKMIYSSMHDYGEEFIRKNVEYGVKKYGEKYVVALGVLAPGFLGTEPEIKTEVLERDLRICSEAGVKEIVLYRLGGLNKEYVKIIENFS